MPKVVVQAKLIVVSPSGELLILLRDASSKTRPGEWDLAGGRVDPGETIEQGATRELEEEAGLKASVGVEDIIMAQTRMNTEFDLSVTWVFYKAVVDETEVTISSEHTDYRWVSLGDAIQSIPYDVQREALVYAQENGLI